MKHVVFFSGGACSYCAAKRVIENVGKENVVLLFTDTKIEDEDLYRFIDEAAEKLGAKLIKIADGRTPFEVYRDSKFLGNNRVAPCSHILKQKTAHDYIFSNYDPEETVLFSEAALKRLADKMLEEVTMNYAGIEEGFEVYRCSRCQADVYHTIYWYDFCPGCGRKIKEWK